MHEINIDPSFLTSVTIHKEWSRYDGRTDLTAEELIKVIKGEDRYSMTSSEDHPEFNKLRLALEKEGYITVQRSWWNGDRVLKSFILNGKKFKRGEQFPSGAAMTGHLKYMKK